MLPELSRESDGIHVGSLDGEADRCIGCVGWEERMPEYTRESKQERGERRRREEKRREKRRKEKEGKEEKRKGKEVAVCLIYGVLRDQR
jgi:hypothetical protein